jgi:drug/metabolite transporter (DMT)-like permease
VAHLVLAATILTWSFSFLAAARLREAVGLGDALAARFVPVLVGSALILLVLRSRRPLRLPRAAWPKIVAMGLLSVPAYNVFFFHGMKTVPSGTASLVIALNPVFTAVLARLVLGEAFGVRRVAGLVLSLVGLFIVVRYGTDKAVDWPYLSSTLLLALAPLSWALYTVIGRTLPAGSDPVDTAYALLFVGSLPLLVFSNLSIVRTLATHPAALASALYLAVPCTLVAWVTFLWALKRLPAGETAAFIFLNPPLANLWAALFEGAKLHAAFVVGAGVLLLGVASIVLPQGRTRRPASSGG